MVAADSFLKKELGVRGSAARLELWLQQTHFHNGCNDSARVESCTRSGREHTQHGRADWDGTFFCSSLRVFFCSSVRLASPFALSTVGEELTNLAILSTSHADFRLLRIPAPEAD